MRDQTPDPLNPTNPHRPKSSVDHRGARFVVLHHVPGAGFDRTDHEHFDWMFESDDGLRTWATTVCDFDHCDLELRGRSLPPHRIAYLDYEGPVSGDRGTVRRVLSGTYTITDDGDDRFAANLSIDGNGGTFKVTLRNDSDSNNLN